MTINNFIKILPVLSAILLGCGTVMAQREYSPNFSVGFKGGATMSGVSFTPEVHQKMLRGTTFGVTARYTEERFFGLVAEVNFVQGGWEENFARDEAPQFQYHRTLNYIRVPLLTHIYFGSKRVKGFFNLGPEAGFMISDNVKANFDWHNYESVPDFPQGYRNNVQINKPIDNKFDYGIAGGAGIEIFINRCNSIQLEGRFYFGLGNIFSDSKRDYFASSRNTSIEVSIQYLFRII